MNLDFKVYSDLKEVNLLVQFPLSALDFFPSLPSSHYLCMYVLRYVCVYMHMYLSTREEVKGQPWVLVLSKASCCGYVHELRGQCSHLAVGAQGKQRHTPSLSSRRFWGPELRKQVLYPLCHLPWLPPLFLFDFKANN